MLKVNYSKESAIAVKSAIQSSNSARDKIHAALIAISCEAFATANCSKIADLLSGINGADGKKLALWLRTNAPIVLTQKGPKLNKSMRLDLATAYNAIIDTNTNAVDSDESVKAYRAQLESAPKWYEIGQSTKDSAKKAFDLDAAIKALIARAEKEQANDANAIVNPSKLEKLRELAA